MLADVIRSPADAIRKKRDEKHIIEMLLVNSLVVAVAAGLFVARFAMLSSLYMSMAVIIASTLFLLVFFGAMFIAYVLQLITNTLGGRGAYKDGMAAVAYALAAPAVGFFAASLLLFIPLVGFFFAVFVVALTLALGIATLYRAVKELFRVDMIVSFISVSVLTLSLIAAVYGMVILKFASRFMGV